MMRRQDEMRHENVTRFVCHANLIWTCASFFLHAWDFGLSKSNLFVTQFVLLSFPPQGYLADQYLLRWVSSNLQKSHIHCIQLSCGPLPKLISNSTRSWRLGFERAWGMFHWSRMDLVSSSCCKQTDKHMLVTQYSLGDIKVLPSWKKKKKQNLVSDSDDSKRSRVSLTSHSRDRNIELFTGSLSLGHTKFSKSGQALSCC